MPQLRAGAARAVITPDIGCHIPGYYEDRVAVDIHGDLHAKAVVLDSGDTCLAICVCDVIALPRGDVLAAKARTEEMTGIPAANVLLQATHTHYGPATAAGYAIPRDDAYMERLPGRIATAIRLAQNRLRPAVLGHASASCSGEVFNRRFWMKDGSVQMNPGGGPNVLRPAGPVDPEVGLLVVLDTERRPIAVLANYALHYVGGPGVLDTIVHADYFGAFDQALQRLAGAPFVAVMMNGCCGDVNHIDVTRPVTYPYPFSEIDRVAEVVAGQVYSAWRGLRDYQADVKLGVANSVHQMRRREVTPERLAQAKERLAKVKEGGLQGSATSQPDFLFDVTATAIHDTPPVWELPVQALRIGDLGIAALHSEVFVEIGLDLKRRSPFPRTFVAELANGGPDFYLPTDTAYDEGSYEVWSTPAERGSAEHLAALALTLLEQLARD